MKSIFGLTFLILISCQFKQEKKAVVNNVSIEQNVLSEINGDSLFELDFIHEENFVRIKAPKQLNFSLPDSSAKIEPYKFEDLNTDGKDDVVIYLGACGTGGCMYGVFLNQYKNFYKLTFMDYLKGIEFEKEKNGFLSIKSYEEVEPYNPSKLYVTKFKFDEKKYQYKIDTTYMYIDK